MYSWTTRNSSCRAGWTGLIILTGWLLLSSFIHTASAAETGQQSWTEQEISGQQIIGQLIDGQQADDHRQLFAQLSSGSRPMPETSLYRKPEQPTVYLTFDDGPGKHTESVLDILKQEQVPATFFVIGQLVSGREDLILRMEQEGHAIGNHTYNHVYEELYSDFESFWEQVQRTNQILEEVLGYPPSLFRAPGGTYRNFDSFYYYYMEQAGFHVVDWNVDSRDAIRKGVSSADIIAEIRGSVLRHELIVLLHDGNGHEATLKALPEIISYYRELGYSFAALGESVEPVQFRVADNSWNRTYTYSSHLDTSSRMLSMRTERESDGTAPSNPSLFIHMGDSGVRELEPDQHRFQSNRFSVPLRQLVDIMGGEVEWDEDRRIAVVRIGTTITEIDPIGRTVIQQSLWQPPAVHHLADVSLEDGQIRIALRAGVRLLGGQVSGYTLGGDKHTVELTMREERQPVMQLHKLADWRLQESRKSYV